MGKFGEKLRRERELRGVTLEEIAEATKIGTRSLRALEEERFDQLPGGIFNKGFVRSYAKFLGLDQEQAVADYLAAMGEQPSKVDVVEKMAAQAEAARKNDAASTGEQGKRSSTIWITAAVLILLIAGGEGGWRYYQRQRQLKLEAQQAAQQQELQQQQQQALQQAAAAPVPDPNASGSAASPVDATTTTQSQTGTTGTQSSSGFANPVATPQNPVSSAPPNSADPKKTQPVMGSTEPAKSPLELQIHVSRATWISVQADGKTPSTETLRDSATKTINAQDRVVLTTGNSVELNCNGKPLGTFGTDNQRSQLRISSDCKVN